MRYRYDAAGSARYKRVKPIIEPDPWDPAERLPYWTEAPADRPRRWTSGWPRTTGSGKCGSGTPARWPRAERLWALLLSAAKRFASGDRLSPVPDQLETVTEVYHGTPLEKPHEKPTGINGESSGGLSWCRLRVRHFHDATLLTVGASH